MPSLFPGVDPYLENPALWPNVRGRLIVAIADALSPLLLPNYQPIIEESVYKTNTSGSVMVGVPDVAIQQTGRNEERPSMPFESAVALAEPMASPVVVELPMPKTFRQRFIEIRNTANQEVVTVIEVLSPANKRGEGRVRYMQKRDQLLESQANLVEIDLLHKGDALPMVGGDIFSHYRIVVSKAANRPQALLYPFNLAQPLPEVSIPLRSHDQEPVISFQALLSQVYDRSGYAYSINYAEPPDPKWDKSVMVWIGQKIEASLDHDMDN